MGIRDLYSRRKKLALKGSEPDVYQYDELPTSLCTQITNIWIEAIGPYLEYHPYSYREAPPNNTEGWDGMHDAFAHEKGLVKLGRHENKAKNCADYLHSSKNIDDALDIIEFSFRYVILFGKLTEWQRKNAGIKTSAEKAIDELNFRFRDAAVGYQFEAGRIIRVDSLFLHAEVVKPALALMSVSGFKGPFAEFTAAHANYRAKDYKGCVAEALKSFESVLKAICKQRGWQYDENATASPLIKLVLEKGLVPKYMESSMQGLQSVLTGLSTVRNKAAGHGQGMVVREVPEYLASYALHLAATNIVFLISAHIA
jgi:hypothetical protein